MTSEPERLSDERLAKFRIGHLPWNEEVIRMARELIALRAERAKDAKRIDNLGMIVVRLNRSLPKDNSIRVAALDYLAREGLMPSVLRTGEQAARAGGVRPTDCKKRGRAVN